MKKALIAAGLLLVMAGIIGGALAYASVGTGDDGLEVKPAPIHEVDVYIAESFPPQVMVHVQGGLSDGCTTLREIKTERNGSVVNIKVTTQRPKEAICTQVYGYFEEGLNLGSDFVSGEAYTFNVNDVMTVFVMP